MNECGGFNFVRPEELPSSSESIADNVSFIDDMASVESIDLEVKVDVSPAQLALLLGPVPSSVPLHPQTWQTNYAPYVSDDSTSEAQSYPSVSTCAFDCCKVDGPPCPSWWK